MLCSKRHCIKAFKLKLFFYKIAGDEGARKAVPSRMPRAPLAKVAPRLLSEFDTFKTAKAGFWLWLEPFFSSGGSL